MTDQPLRQATGHTVDCELGELETASSDEGRVEIMLHPELLKLHSSDSGTATVTGREFYGHDQLIKARLDSGADISFRPGPGLGFRPGERATVQTADPAAVYPADPWRLRSFRGTKTGIRPQLCTVLCMV